MDLSMGGEGSSYNVYVRGKRGRCEEVVVNVEEKRQTARPVRSRLIIDGPTEHPIGGTKGYNPNRQLWSLQECCLNFVAKHADAVDSWVGFPEEMAKSIFDRLEQHSLEFVKPFAEAFPELVMPQCSMSDLDFFNYYDSTMLGLLHRTKFLCLTGCDLGGHHEILKAVHYMENLQLLDLSGCGLVNASMMSLVRSCPGSNGFKSLIEIDLSNNHISAYYAARLLRLPGHTLQTISVSMREGKCHGKVAEFKEAFGKKIFPDRWEHVFNMRYPAPPKRPPFPTYGWATELFQKLREEDEARAAAKRARSRIRQSTFYGQNGSGAAGASSSAGAANNVGVPPIDPGCYYCNLNTKALQRLTLERAYVPPPVPVPVQGKGKGIAKRQRVEAPPPEYIDISDDDNDDDEEMMDVYNPQPPTFNHKKFGNNRRN